MRKQILAVLLCGMMILGMTACAGKPAQAEPKEEPNVEIEQRKNVQGVDEKTGDKYYLLADFENYYECTQVKYGGSFGTITQIKKSEEPDMVTCGEQSAKLEILGVEETWKTQSPYMRFATTTDFFNLTTDLSDMSRFAFDIYNAQDYAVTIRFYVDQNVDPRYSFPDAILTNDNYEYCITNKIELQPGQWNHVEIPAEEMKIVQYTTEGKAYYVTGAEALQTVGAFVILFDRGELHENAQIYYMDNVRAYLGAGNAQAE